MQKETLANDAFYIARQSQHQYGIGQYGIGLKRSLLKMGEQYHFFIDNGRQCYEFDFPNTVLTVRKIKFLRKKKHPEAILKPDLQSLGYIVKIQGEN